MVQGLFFQNGAKMSFKAQNVVSRVRCTRSPVLPYLRYKVHFFVCRCGGSSFIRFERQHTRR